jgi:DNA-binding CsgD family transcriptional regulator
MNVPKTIEVKLEESLENQVIDLIKRDYSMVAGDKVRNMFAKDIGRLVQNLYREPSMMEIGQILWMGVVETEKPSYGKNAYNTRFKPVILTPISKEDLSMMGNGYSFREVREQRIVRLFHEAKEQGTLLTNADVGLLLGVSAGTVSKQVREYMERENKVIPTRGIVHDIGRAITHKRIIIREYLRGYLPPEIASRTSHSEAAVERYIKAFNKVKMLSKKMDLKHIARTLDMSEYLVNEYLELLEEYFGGDINV